MGGEGERARRRPGAGGGPVILYTLGSMKIGGAEIRALELLEALKRERPGLDVTVYVTCREGGPLEADFRGLGINVVEGPRGLAGVAHLWRLCARSKVEILHSNADTVSGFHCLAGALAGVGRRIAHYHITAAPGDDFYQRLILYVGRALMKLFATDVIGVCDGARALAAVPEERWTTLYDGVDCLAAAAAPDPDGPRRLLFLARIHPDKDFNKAVAIFECLMARSATPAELHFVGTGSAEEVARLGNRVAASPSADAIAIHGASREPQEHLGRASLLLLPSVREGLPGSVLEALSHGVPVVASDLPGLREIAERCKGVRLVPRSAPLEQWVDAVEAALAEDREGIGTCFSRSPFRFSDHKRRIEALWNLPPGPIA
jgi:glycosyltransferase involved in cell wall biosynthesis